MTPSPEPWEQMAGGTQDEADAAYIAHACVGHEDGMDGYVVHAASCPVKDMPWLQSSRCVDYVKATSDNVSGGTP